MPMIREQLSKTLGVPVEINDPDKAVARGAAILAAELANPPKIAGPSHSPETARITPVLPKAIGTYVHSSLEPWRPEPYVRQALKANTPLPVVAHEVSVATILDNQESARIRLYEQGGAMTSERVEDNRLVFDGEISGIPKGQGGNEIRLLISVGIDGRIDVKAVDRKNKPLKLECFIEGVLDEAEVHRQTAAVAGLVLAD